ncbi:thiamine pyrophosphate-binding protein [Pigmentiphaga sp.]|uniref:thiamine pyrophosphate-binding protein n=1 Tax=Pigmentiphaga sp. TaxID=1977564 RepID=UPI00128C385F|nr:thiamine pyrophosphate-binding protein [Pigmentiphaga sp.]MPS25817.1 thiamine pyrophosphate-binding protein [Alcaligenaceae bacterium SAGV5]MPS53317.1 thiamine pyrophosphate-binding protein [Alcaligenaceae bacterium SAGV3]MPT58927.1 thiamine pyrophosphate-binding protein [Alcaligenaceae bacterium]
MPNVNRITVGAAIAQFLENCGVKAAFGVISIHNMPILDAFGERGNIRFVMARGEAGATNMADAYARTTGGLGVTVTSTGTAAGNAAGSMVEAITAGTPLLHLTGQIDSPYLDQNLGFIHEANHQLDMLQAVSKAAFRIRTPETAIGIVKRAVQIAMTAPTGPVSIEIPIDVQAALIDEPADLNPLPVAALVPAEAALDELANRLAQARRPLLWLGGGARQAGEQVRRLVKLGFGVITSTQGRGVIPENDPACLGSFTVAKPVENLYQTVDALLVVGSRLRSNETLKYAIKLPATRYRIDADSQADGRAYTTDFFVNGDATLALKGLADRLEGKMSVDPRFLDDIQAARQGAMAKLRDDVGPYTRLIDTLQSVVGESFNWVRDVTLSNSIWGNRLPCLHEPKAGVHALGGGIGLGLAMGVGAAVGAAVTGSGKKTFTLAGDGGFILNLGELATAVQEQADMLIVLMNDQAYGVIKNIQDAVYGGRKHYVQLHTPDYALLTQAMGLGHARVKNLDELEGALKQGLAAKGPFIVEIDMLSVGGFNTKFAGPPVKAATDKAGA